MLRSFLRRRALIGFSLVASALIGIIVKAESPDILWARGGDGFGFTAFDMTPDGSLLVSGDTLGYVRVWRTSDGIVPRMLDAHPPWVEGIAISRDGKMVASIDSKGALILWDLPEGTIRWSTSAQSSNLNRVRIAPDGQRIATSGADGTVRLWRAEDGSLAHEYPGHSTLVWGLDFSSDGQILASAGSDRAVRFWRVSNGASAGSINLVSQPRALALSPDNQTVAVGAFKRVDLWRVTDSSLVGSLTNETGTVLGLRYSADGSSLASIDTIGQVTLWNVATRDAQSIWSPTESDSDAIAPMAMSGDGKLLAFRNDQDDLSLWRADGATNPTVISLRNVSSSVVISPDGQFLATRGDPVRVYDASDGMPVPGLDGSLGKQGWVEFSADGSMIAGIEGGKISLWSFPDGQLIRQFPENSTPGQAPVSPAVFSPDGTMIATADDEQFIQLWRVADGALLRTLSGHANHILSLAFSPGGELLVSSSRDETLKVNGVHDGELKTILTGHTDWVMSAAFSQDGSTVASASRDGTIRLWNVSDGSNYRTIDTGADFSEVVFLDDERYLLSADGDPSSAVLKGSIRIWRVADGSLVRTFSDNVGYCVHLRVATAGNRMVYGRLDGSIVVATLPTVLPAGSRLELTRSGSQGFLWIRDITRQSLTVQRSTDSLTWVDMFQLTVSAGALQVPVDLDEPAMSFRVVEH